MSLTITEKILKEHSQEKNISPGNFLEADIDLWYMNN